jgi:aspartate aminotransferase-like enzyme
VPFTISSNLVYPLHTALAQFRPERFDKIANLSARLRAKLIASGFQIVGSEMHTMPGVVTVALPQGTRSEDVGDQLQQAGYLVSYRSEYLLRRNWIQFCLMGEYNKNSLGHFVDIFLGIVAKTALKYDKVYLS